MEEVLAVEETQCDSSPKREQFFNEEFAYSLVMSVAVCTYAIINVVSLIA